MLGGKKTWLVPLLAGLAVLIVSVVLWSSSVGDAIRAWKSDAGVVTFFGVMTVLPAVGVPMTPFFALAGATFGQRVGLIGSMAALALNLILCYRLARSQLRPRIAPLFERFGVRLPELESERKRGRALRFTVLVKLAPGLPAFAKNYALGIAGVPFALYFVVSMIITGIYGAALIVLGESVFRHDVDRTMAAAIAIVLAAAATWFVARRSRRSTVT